MHHIHTLRLLTSLIALQACTNIRSEDMVDTWSIDQWVEDGIDKTDQLASQPWGTALQLAKDGSFRTNGRQNNQGSWKINQERSTIYFRTLAEDSTDFEQVSFMNEANLP